MGTNEIFGEFLGLLQLDMGDIVNCCQYASHYLSHKILRMFAFDGNRSMTYEQHTAIYHYNPEIYRFFQLKYSNCMDRSEAWTLHFIGYFIRLYFCLISKYFITFYSFSSYLKGPLISSILLVFFGLLSLSISAFCPMLLTAFFFHLFLSSKRLSDLDLRLPIGLSIFMNYLEIDLSCTLLQILPCICVYIWWMHTLYVVRYSHLLSSPIDWNA